MSVPEIKADVDGKIIRQELKTEKQKMAYLLASNMITQLKNELSAISYQSINLGAQESVQQIELYSEALNVTMQIVEVLNRSNKVLSIFKDINDYGANTKRLMYCNLVNNSLDELMAP